LPKALALQAAAVFAAATAFQPALAIDRCQRPTPNPSMSMEGLRRQGGDARPLALAAVNLAFAEDDCLRRTAYRRRGAHEPIEVMVSAMLEQCAPTSRAYEAAQAKAAPSPAALVAGRRDDRRKTAQMALGYAHAYRSCAR